jgi:ATP-dependent Lhr-like helicase
MQMNHSKGFKIVTDYLSATGKRPFTFQLETWEAFLQQKSGLLNAPTGCGKTYALFLPAIIQFINRYDDWQTRKDNGLQLLWITPLRALAKDLQRAMQEVCDAISLPWKVGVRTGDTSLNERAKQKKQMPEILIITPESLMLLLAQKNALLPFQSLQAIVADEWHELLGSKRGVQVELALSKIRYDKPELPVWGISATIGNLTEAAQVLLGWQATDFALIKANVKKQVAVHSIIPDEVEKYPWAGHLGIKLLQKAYEIIEQSNTVLLFTNTRSQSEIWFHALLDNFPELAGCMALHHGSIDAEVREWIEEALHSGVLKVVVCTSSLDLGVDFRPVDTVIQVGSPKGVARFLQRAGRSGHTPDAVSKIYFLPTHSLELIEATALKKCIEEEIVEAKTPVLNAFDVLIQYLGTLACGDGFEPQQVLREIKKTYAYQFMTHEEFRNCVNFLVHGSTSLMAYDEYKKVINDNGIYRMANRRLAMRHRLNIGTIVSDAVLKVKFLKGGFIGTIEEWFISKLTTGDSFVLAGKKLELVSIKDMTVLVRKSTADKATIPSWAGGRMSLSSNLGAQLRYQLQAAGENHLHSLELQSLEPLFKTQAKLSKVPKEGELLIEYISSREGYHLFIYPFEGRQVHEVMAALLAFRISQMRPISFSIAMNDYGFELLSDTEIELSESFFRKILSPDHLIADIQTGINAAEMAKRKFRDIAVIAGLVFQGYPGNFKTGKHLQASSSLLFKVFSEHEKDNVLLQQAYREVFDNQLEERRLREALQRIEKSKLLIVRPEKFTPFCFPIQVDSMWRESLSSEKLEDRVKRMKLKLEKE